MTREATNKVLEMVEEGLLDRDTVIMACLKYMSEDDVRDMAHANEIEWQASGEEEPDEFHPARRPSQELEQPWRTKRTKQTSKA